MRHATNYSSRSVALHLSLELRQHLAKRLKASDVAFYSITSYGLVSTQSLRAVNDAGLNEFEPQVCILSIHADRNAHERHNHKINATEKTCHGILRPQPAIPTLVPSIPRLSVDKATSMFPPPLEYKI